MEKQLFKYLVDVDYVSVIEQYLKLYEFPFQDSDGKFIDFETLTPNKQRSF